MRRVLRKHLKELTAIVVLMVIAVCVGSVVLSKQRVTLPGWVPLVGKDTFNVEAELASAQAVTPGQGQSVVVAGVKVGEIVGVRLDDGRAVIKMRLNGEFRHRIFNDASILLRPKTGLKDMVAQLDPGNKPAGELPSDQRISIARTLPDVNFDEILASLDGDTRDYLKLLLDGASKGLEGNAANLSNTLRRFQPTARDLRKISEALAKRRHNLKRVVHNLSLLTEELGSKDKDLAAFVSNSNAVFEILARQDQTLKAALTELPSTLKATDKALSKSEGLSRELGTTLEAVRPGFRGLAKTQPELRKFLTETTPTLRDKIRPFTKEALPTAKDLRPATHDLAAATPDAIAATEVLNKFLNTLAFKPSGQEGYLFWLAWTNHLANSLFSIQDAHGPLRRGLFMASCGTIGILSSVAAANPQLGTLVGLLNAPTQAEICPTQGAGAAKQ